MEASGTEGDTENAVYVRTKSLTSKSSEKAAACQSRVAAAPRVPRCRALAMISRAYRLRRSTANRQYRSRIGDLRAAGPFGKCTTDNYHRASGAGQTRCSAIAIAGDISTDSKMENGHAPEG